MDEHAFAVFWRHHAALRAGASREERLWGERSPNPLQERLDALIAEGHDAAWPVLMQLIAGAPSDEARCFLGAGPLENLLHWHGERVAAAVAEQARRDARVRLALSCVWLDEGMPAAVRDSL